MKCLPVYPKEEAWSCDEACYDPHEVFATFLDEARKYELETRIQSSPAKAADAEPQMSKKTWKRSLSFLFWKPGRKSSARKAEHSWMNGPTSGPIKGGETLLRRSIRRPASASGTLAACFAPTMADEAEARYMCLGSRSCPSGSGPLYLVT